MTGHGRFAPSSVGLLLLCGLAVFGCSNPAPAPPAAPTLWGDLKPVVSVKELMASMIDPLADSIFDAVGTEVTTKAFLEKTPKTDADWEQVRNGAISLAEGIYLLKVPRPLAPAGDVNNSVGPNPSELSPAQIKAKIDADPVLWNAKIEALRNVALEVLDIVKKKDANALYEASGDLDEACEACHLQYWYPGEDRRREQRRQAAVASGRSR